MISVAAAGVAAGLLVVGVVPEVRGRVGPGELSLRASPGRGASVVELPPLGRVEVATPRMPVVLAARVESVDLEQLQTTLSGPDPEGALLHGIGADLLSLLRRFALRAGIVATAAGALVPFLFPARRWWFAAVGGGAALAAVAGLGALAWATFDPEAFREPRFEGALERAPAIVEAAQRHVDSLEGVADRVRTLGRQISDLYAASALVDVGGHVPGETRILHVSDIHSNPLGIELVTRLAAAFSVDAVLDTGDLTSFGVPLEGVLVERLSAVAVPYLFVPGNHDSESNRALVAALPNVRLLDGNVETIGDVRVLGIADPTFTAGNEVGTDEANAAKQQASGAVAGAVRRLRPNLLAVHDTRLADRALGDVPLVVAGHVHRRTSVLREGTRVLTVGSTGATGLGTFTVDTDSRYEAQVLRFVEGSLVAIDHLSVRGVGGSFTIERSLVERGEDGGQGQVMPFPPPSSPGR